MSKYTLRVRQIVAFMQIGATLESRMIQTGYSPRTGNTEVTRYVFLNDTILGGSSANLIRATRGDLIEVESKDPHPFGDVVYRLTERGQKIRWNHKGEEMPDNWTPPPPKPRPFPHSGWVGNLGLLPKLNVIVLCRTREDWERFWREGNRIEPILQLPSPIEEVSWTLAREGKTMDNIKKERKRVKGRMCDRYVSYDVIPAIDVRPAKRLEFEEFAKEFLPQEVGA